MLHISFIIGEITQPKIGDSAAAVLYIPGMGYIKLVPPANKPIRPIIDTPFNNTPNKLTSPNPIRGPPHNKPKSKTDHPTTITTTHHNPKYSYAIKPVLSSQQSIRRVHKAHTWNVQYCCSAHRFHSASCKQAMVLCTGKSYATSREDKSNKKLLKSIRSGATITCF